MVATLLDRLKLRFETDLADNELQRIIDEGAAEIARLYGPDPDAGAPVVEVIPAGDTLIFLSRPAATITSVVITDSAGTETTLVADTDFRTWYGGRVIERVGGLYWAPSTVTYVPLDDTSQRQEVVIKLAILTLEYRALKSERAGDYSATFADYTEERAKILGSLRRWPLLA